MSDQFLAEIRIFPFNFPPRGWAFCNGQLIPLSQNTALFSLLGTVYGGDGKSTFALPDLQDSAPVQPGQGAGLSTYLLGQIGGEPFVTLLESEIPAHRHTINATSQGADQADPANNVWAQAVSDQGAFNYYQTTGTNAMDPRALTPAGSSLPHNNLHPYLALSFCIALQGVFPPRT